MSFDLHTTAQSTAGVTPAPRRLALSAITVDDHQYRFSHGHAPRGRGGWAFEFGHTRELVWIPGSMTYSSAKSRALRMAQKRGVSIIRVAT